MTTISGEAVSAASQVLQIELEGGRDLEATLRGPGSADALDDVLQQLESATFVRIGEDVIVRAADVRSIRVHSHGDEDAGLVDTLKRRLGGNDMSYDAQRGGGTAVQQRPDGGRNEPGIADQFFAYGQGRPWAETKPFFLTSEFLAFVLGAAGVLIAAWVADNLDAPRAWLIAAIVTSAYIVSRGLAKAGTRDPNPRHNDRGWGR